MGRTILAVLLILVVSASALAGKVEKHKKIIGGDTVRPHEFPYQIMFQVNGYSYCGGGIISRRFFITAAHCFGDWTNRSVVVAGVHNRLDYSATGQERKIKHYIKHQDYNKTGNREHDIGLVFVDKPFEYNEFVQKISLPPNGDYPWEKAVATGWGYTNGSDNTSYSQNLQKVTLDVLNETECKAIWKDLFAPLDFCAHVKGRNAGTCHGDSGGPVSQMGKCGQLELVGITSFGIGGCIYPSNTGMFVRVGPHLDWIKQAKVILWEREGIKAK